MALARQAWTVVYMTLLVHGPMATVLYAQPIEPTEEGPVDETDDSPRSHEAPSPVVTPPKLQGEAAATYPERALEARPEAVVVLEIDIDAQGHVEAVSVVESATGEADGLGFEEAALEAARGWRFEPATADGEPVAVRITYTLRFVPPSMEEPSQEPPTVTEAPIRLEGRVLERGTRDPLVGVRVVVFRDGGGGAMEGYEAETDMEGRFVFRGLEDGRWRVWVEPEGYYPLRTEEVVEQGQRMEVLYWLERGAYNRYDVLVEGDPENLGAAVTRRSVAMEEMERMPGIYGDPVKVLRTLPGVAQTSVFTSDIIIRGGAPEDTRFFSMGLRVPAVFHFGGIRGVFPAGMVDQLILYPGDFPVYYGRSIGGVVDLSLPDRVGDRPHGTLDTSLLDTNLYLEVPIGDHAWVAGSARRSYIDAVIGGVGLIFDEPLILPRYWDAHLQAGWRPAPDHELRLFVFFADDDFVIYSVQGDEIDIDEGDLPETDMVQLGLRHTWTPSESLTWTTSLLLGTDRRLEVDGLSGTLSAQFDTGRIETRTRRLALRSDLQSQIAEQAKARIGLDVVASKVELSTEQELFFEVDAIDGFIPDGPVLELDLFTTGNTTTFTEAGVYADLELQMESLTVIPGARVDYWGQLDHEATFDPRVRAQWTLNSAWALRGALGLMHQAPRPVELDATVGDPSLGPERALQSSLGVLWHPDHGLFQAEIGGFYKRLEQLAQLGALVDVGSLLDGIPTDLVAAVWNNDGRGRAYGLETQLRFPIRYGFNGWIAYTLSRTERWDAAQGQYVVYAFDQTHNLTLFGSLRLPRNWSIGTRFQYATGFPIYDELGVGRFLDRSLAFHQWDIRVDKIWVYQNWTLNAYFDLQNVYNRFNLAAADSTSESSESVPPPGVPILPIIGFKSAF
ncbi:MAG: TonB family protein [Myxococcota bacterium]